MRRRSWREDLVWAYATYGALAFGLLGIALTRRGRDAARRRARRASARRGGRRGRLRGARPVRLRACRRARRRCRSWLCRPGGRGSGSLAGFLAALGAVSSVHLAIVGPERVESRRRATCSRRGPGRYLPSADVLGLPREPARRRESRRRRLLLGVGAFSDLATAVGARAAGCSWPRALQRSRSCRTTLSRADPLHIRPYAVVPLSLLPALALLAVRGSAGRDGWRSSRRSSSAVVTVGCLATATTPSTTSASVRDVRAAIAASTTTTARARGSSSSARGASRARRLAVRRPAGPPPHELRSDVHVLPAPRAGAGLVLHGDEPGNGEPRRALGLADELREADWLILTSEWDNWNEPNDSMDFGPSEPNEVVRDDLLPPARARAVSAVRAV